MDAPTHLLVANPTAQSGRNAGRIEQALRLLRGAGLSARLLPTEPGGQTAARVREALDVEPIRCVIAMGGDGTFREAGEGLLASARRDEVTLGMLPAGTANNHAKSFGLDASPHAMDRNVGIIAAGRETRLDAGRIHAMDERGVTVVRAVFFDSVGFGAGAAVIAARNEDRAWARRAAPLDRVYRDELVYAGAALRTLARPRRGNVVEAAVTADGEPLGLGPLAELLIRGTRIYAGGWAVDPTSRHDDGQFEVIPFPSLRDWLSRAALGLARVEAAAPPGTRRASRIDIELRPGAGGRLPRGQMDGEEMPAVARVSIAVEARAVRLIVP